MKAGMRRYGWIGVFLLGGVTGAITSRALRSTEDIRVLLYAPQGVRECKMNFSIETTAAWGGFPAIGDGGGAFACDYRGEVSPGLWVACNCLDDGRVPDAGSTGP
jgi:hypothetical protein